MGYCYGPKWTTLVAALSDFIGAWLFPFGTYFAGYTICCVFTGLIYGLFLYKPKDDTYTNKQFIIRLILASVLELVFVSVVLKSACIYFTSGKVITAILPTRIINAAAMLPIQIIAIFLLEKGLRKPINMFLREE